ncbi:hypothetical protein NL676_019226 [Syzygium grande]|nr:hypothetical protein NL676_019226 [Syzygium grande]
MSKLKRQLTKVKLSDSTRAHSDSRCSSPIGLASSPDEQQSSKQIAFLTAPVILSSIGGLVAVRRVLVL